MRRVSGKGLPISGRLAMTASRMAVPSGAGENDGNGCDATQQDTQQVLFNRGVEAADHGRALEAAGVGPVLRPQDYVARTRLGAKKEMGDEVSTPNHSL